MFTRGRTTRVKRILECRKIALIASYQIWMLRLLNLHFPRTCFVCFLFLAPIKKRCKFIIFSRTFSIYWTLIVKKHSAVLVTTRMTIYTILMYLFKTTKYNSLFFITLFDKTCPKNMIKCDAGILWKWVQLLNFCQLAS